MAKNNFPKINVKAAAITGAVIGFLLWLLVVPFGLVGYGMMGGYSYPYYGMIGYFYPAYNGISIGYPYYGGMMGGAIRLGLLSIIIDIVLGAVAGALIALVYNWALKLK